MSGDRFNQGKLRLSHIHPTVWKFMMSDKDVEVHQELRCMELLFLKHLRDFPGDTLNDAYLGVCDVVLDHIEEITAVLEFGAKKYSSFNYMKGLTVSEVLDSYRRHQYARLVRGEEIDGEGRLDELDENGKPKFSGLPHRWHELCNLMFFLAMIDNPLAKDDRPK